MSIPNRIRQARTQLAFEDLKEQVSEWLTMRRTKDRDQSYLNQFNTIEVLLNDAHQQLYAAFHHLDLSASPGLFYDECTQFELRILWLRRVWEYFREKFDQRDDSKASQVLAAADEIVWSCYAPPFLRSGNPRGPTPLPFLEARCFSAAYITDLVSPASKRGAEVALEEFLKQIPVPLISLPPVCVKEPWWLIYIAHEVGHHVQHDLLPENGLVTWFKDGIKKIVFDAKCANAEISRWGIWSAEIFADAYSVCCMGPWAVSATLELELKNPHEMVRSRATFPPPLVRLRLIAEIADKLSGSKQGTLALRELATVDGSAVARELSLVPKLAEFALRPLADLGLTMPDLCNFQSTDIDVLVPWWRDQFCKQDKFIHGANVPNARIVVSAALAAWERIAGEQVGCKLETARLTLADQLQHAILCSPAKGLRRTSSEHPEIDALIKEAIFLGAPESGQIPQRVPEQVEVERISNSMVGKLLDSSTIAMLQDLEWRIN